jgi:hypothetical protein
VTLSEIGSNFKLSDENMLIVTVLPIPTILSASFTSYVTRETLDQEN